MSRRASALRKPTGPITRLSDNSREINRPSILVESQLSSSLPASWSRACQLSRLLLASWSRACQLSSSLLASWSRACQLSRILLPCRPPASSFSAAVAVDEPANKKALDGLLGLHTKLAGRKLTFPKVPVEIGGFFPGSISGTIVPPFDFADTIPTLLANVTNPTLSASANVNGQISASAVTSQTPGFNGGSEYREWVSSFIP